MIQEVSQREDLFITFLHNILLAAIPKNVILCSLFYETFLKICRYKSLRMFSQPLFIFSLRNSGTEVS